MKAKDINTAINWGVGLGAAYFIGTAIAGAIKKHREQSGANGIGALGLKSERNREKAKKDLAKRIDRVSVIAHNILDDNTIWKEESSVKSLAYYSGGQTDKAWDNAEKISNQYNAELRKALDHLNNAIVIVKNI